MADYLISKAAVQKMLIDLREHLNEHYISLGISMALQKMEGFKPADAVEVVRCRECEYRGDELKCPMCFDEWDEDEPGFLRIDKTVDAGFCHMGAKMDGGAGC